MIIILLVVMYSSMFLTSPLPIGPIIKLIPLPYKSIVFFRVIVGSTLVSSM